MGKYIDLIKISFFFSVIPTLICFSLCPLFGLLSLIILPTSCLITTYVYVKNYTFNYKTGLIDNLIISTLSFILIFTFSNIVAFYLGNIIFRNLEELIFGMIYVYILFMIFYLISWSTFYYVLKSKLSQV